MTDQTTTTSPSDVADLLRWSRASRHETTAGYIARLEATVARLEAEYSAFRDKAEATFREQHETNMRLVGQVERLRSDNAALTLALQVAQHENERLMALIAPHHGRRCG